MKMHGQQSSTNRRTFLANLGTGLGGIALGSLLVRDEPLPIAGKLADTFLDSKFSEGQTWYTPSAKKLGRRKRETSSMGSK